VMCPDCGRLRHPGTPCEEPYDGEPDFAQPDYLEMLAIDAQQAIARYRAAKQMRAANEFMDAMNETNPGASHP
jgi:hypothetical protein